MSGALHWHPDHVLGRRVWESRNADWANWPPRPVQTPIYLPEQVVHDFKARLGSWEQFEFLAKQGLVSLVELNDGDSFDLNGFTTTPFRLAESYVYGFLIEGEGRRCLICPDETLGWKPEKSLKGVDIAVLPMGIANPHPLTGERVIPPDHPVLKSECSHRETMRIIEVLEPTQTILTHIEEPDQCSHDDLVELEERYRRNEKNIRFAFDGIVVEPD